MAMILGTWSDLPEAVRMALFKAQDWALKARHKSSEANAAACYIRALPESIMGYGIRGAKTQLVYILNNLSRWRGGEAAASKKVLSDYVKQLAQEEKD